MHFLRVFIICIRESFVVSGGLEGGNKSANRREYGTAVNLLHARAQYHKLSYLLTRHVYVCSRILHSSNCIGHSEFFFFRRLRCLCRSRNVAAK